MARVASRLRARPLRESDSAVVRELINADRLPGQPEADASMLAEAVRGRSPVDAGWWAELDPVAVDVLVDADGDPQGVVSYASRDRDDAGLILWLHGRERREVVAALVEHALASLGDRAVVEAFSFASALGVGLEALPVRHRAATAQVLRDAGFAGTDLWRYMRRALPASELPRLEGVQVAVDSDGHRQLRWLEDGRELAEASVSMPVPDIGVLWWISVEMQARHRGLGVRMLGSALHELTVLGAGEVILYVDDDAPPDDPERGRGAANRLYDAAGFVEVDRLHSFKLRR